jgi:hypothetical protein
LNNSIEEKQTATFDEIVESAERSSNQGGGELSRIRRSNKKSQRVLVVNHCEDKRSNS